MSERTSQDVLRELRAAVETLPEGQVRDHTTGKVYGTAQVSRLAVLALIDKAIAEAPDTLSEKPGLDDRLVRNLTKWIMKSGWVRDYEHARAEAEGFANYFGSTDSEGR